MKLDYKIYCWWLNDEEMSENRKQSLDNLKTLTSCEIVFITKIYHLILYGLICLFYRVISLKQLE